MFILVTFQLTSRMTLGKLASVSLSFLICKIGVINYLLVRGVMKIKWDHNTQYSTYCNPLIHVSWYYYYNYYYHLCYYYKKSPIFFVMMTIHVQYSRTSQFLDSLILCHSKRLLRREACWIYSLPSKKWSPFQRGRACGF